MAAVHTAAADPTSWLTLSAPEETDSFSFLLPFLSEAADGALTTDATGDVASDASPILEGEVLSQPTPLPADDEPSQQAPVLEDEAPTEPTRLLTDKPLLETPSSPLLTFKEALELDCPSPQPPRHMLSPALSMTAVASCCDSTNQGISAAVTPTSPLSPDLGIGLGITPSPSISAASSPHSAAASRFSFASTRPPSSAITPMTSVSSFPTKSLRNHKSSTLPRSVQTREGSHTRAAAQTRQRATTSSAVSFSAATTRSVARSTIRSSRLTLAASRSTLSAFFNGVDVGAHLPSASAVSMRSSASFEREDRPHTAHELERHAAVAAQKLDRLHGWLESEQTETEKRKSKLGRSTIKRIVRRMFPAKEMRAGVAAAAEAAPICRSPAVGLPEDDEDAEQEVCVDGATLLEDAVLEPKALRRMPSIGQAFKLPTPA